MYECPIFVYQTQHKLPRTCDGHKAKNLSQLRTHLVRPGRGQRVHCSFLQQCTICHDDFLDECVFTEHVRSCDNVRNQRRGAAADAYYPVFCENILASKNMAHTIRPSKHPLSFAFLMLTQQADHERNITPQGPSALEERPDFVPSNSREQPGSNTYTVSHRSSPSQAMGTWSDVLSDSRPSLDVRQYTQLFEAFLTDIDSRNETCSIDWYPNRKLITRTSSARETPQTD